MEDIMEYTVDDVVRKEAKTEQILMTADQFYPDNLQAQMRILNNAILEAHKTGNPIIRLPFDTYPRTEELMLAAGYAYAPFKDPETGFKCAAFYPHQYNYPNSK